MSSSHADGGSGTSAVGTGARTSGPETSTCVGPGGSGPTGSIGAGGSGAPSVAARTSAARATAASTSAGSGASRPSASSGVTGCRSGRSGSCADVRRRPGGSASGGRRRPGLGRRRRGRRGGRAGVAEVVGARPVRDRVERRVEPVADRDQVAAGRAASQRQRRGAPERGHLAHRGVHAETRLGIARAGPDRTVLGPRAADGIAARLSRLPGNGQGRLPGRRSGRRRLVELLGQPLQAVEVAGKLRLGVRLGTWSRTPIGPSQPLSTMARRSARSSSPAPIGRIFRPVASPSAAIPFRFRASRCGLIIA